MAMVAHQVEVDDANKSGSKIRVTFFESQRPLVVTDTPGTDGSDWTAAVVAGNSKFQRQVSTESGQDNPFRPDGNLSREADEIVQLIKLSGKPVAVNHQNEQDPDHAADCAVMEEPISVSSLPEDQAAAPNGTNGNSSQVFEVQHVVVASPTDAATVEHVHIKKGKGCCVIQ